MTKEQLTAIMRSKFEVHWAKVSAMGIPSTNDPAVKLMAFGMFISGYTDAVELK
jgi:hypothetical protein